MSIDRFFDELQVFYDNNDKRPEEIKQRDAFHFKGLIYAQKVKKGENVKKKKELLENYDPKVFRLIKIKNGKIFVPEMVMKKYTKDQICSFVGLPEAEIVTMTDQTFKELSKK